MEFKHELVLPNDDLPFKMFVFEGKDGNYIREKHWHRSVEIFAVMEGCLDFYINEDAYPLCAGEFILVNSNEIHSIKAPKRNLTIVLQIPLSTFENYYTDEMFIRFTHRSRDEDQRFMTLITEMYETYREKACGYEWKVQSGFCALMYLLVTKYRKIEVNAELVRHSKKLSRLSTITGYIRDHYTREITLESLADIFGYSPTYLSKMFQKYAKTNYKAYLQSVRVEYAFKELMNTDNTISNIAINHGFPNSKAFTKAFQKKYGELPSVYRKHKNK